MPEGCLPMSLRESDRAHPTRRTIEKSLRRHNAAERPGIGPHRFERSIRAWKPDGDADPAARPRVARRTTGSQRRRGLDRRADPPTRRGRGVGPARAAPRHCHGLPRAAPFESVRASGVRSRPSSEIVLNGDADSPMPTTNASRQAGHVRVFPIVAILGPRATGPPLETVSRWPHRWRLRSIA
jgi:hypothetical protein